jgi:hypothetical protein
MSRYPSRIVCLTEETTETLYLLGAGDLVVGVSGYTARPPEARQKPKVSAFINARFDKILALDPDLVLAFSDLQADIAAELIRRGKTVVTFNQRSVQDILRMIRQLGGLVGLQSRAERLADDLERGLDGIRASASRFTHRPRVFFEEWDTPLISGIRWVEELVEIAGGAPLFAELSHAALAKGPHCHSRHRARPRAGSHPCVVVRQESAEGHHRRTPGLGVGACGCERADLRGQVHVHPAARPGIVDGRCPADSFPAVPGHEPPGQP